MSTCFKNWANNFKTYPNFKNLLKYFKTEKLSKMGKFFWIEQYFLNQANNFTPDENLNVWAKTFLID